jgi:hypothetical protein
VKELKIEKQVQQSIAKSEQDLIFEFEKHLELAKIEI